MSAMKRKIKKTILDLLAPPGLQASESLIGKRNDTTPIFPRHDDLFLVSYPKSGSTWLSFIIANINIAMSNRNEVVNFFNIHDFVPDIHLENRINDIRTSFPGYRIIKSHATLNPDYKKVVYLVRNPHDVMLSYYHFVAAQNKFSGSLAEFVRSPQFGIDAWHSHLQGWHDSSPVGLRIYFMRYEDMKIDTVKTLTSMYNILGHKLPETIISEAVERASFSNMKKVESEWGWGNRPAGEKMEFVREGKVGEGSKELSKEDADYITRRTEPFLKRFNYLPT